MGIIAALLAAVFSSSKDLASKKISFSLSGTLSTFASFLFALPYYLAALLVLYYLGYESLELTGEIALLVLLRSLSDTLAELLKMHAIARAEISLLACVFALYPLILLIVSPLITGDSVPLPVILATIMIAAGSQTLAWKSARLSSRDQTKGILLALASTVCFSLNTSFDRLAAKVSTPVFASFSMTLLACFFIWIILLATKQPSRALLTEHKGKLLLRGFFEIGFMVSKLAALTYMTAPHVVGIQSTSLLITIISGSFLFKEKDLKRRLAAGLLIFFGISLILVYG